MNRYCLEENSLMSREDLKNSSSIFHRKQEPLICPKPRRVGVLASTPQMPLRRNLSHQVEPTDLKAGAELLDIILRKECFEDDPLSNQVASSPPYFCGSPPSRSANPLIFDSRFGNENLASISSFSIPSPSGLSSPSAASRIGGCVRMKYGHKPAAVRVEGFDCLNRDRQNSRISAVA